MATPYVGPIEKAQAFGSLVGWFLDYLFSHTFWGDAICEGEFGKQTNKQTNKQTFTYIYMLYVYIIANFKKIYIDILIEPATNTPSLAMLCFCSTFFHIYKAMDLTPHVGSFPFPPPLHQGQVSPFIHTP